jgi:hypothetical protein
MNSEKPEATTVANCVGAFTNVARTVQDFHTAGLPVWFLRDQDHWKDDFDCNILELVDPLIPKDTLSISHYDPPFPVIYRGSMICFEKHAAIHNFSREWLVLKDPFQDGPMTGKLILLVKNDFSWSLKFLNLQLLNPSIVMLLHGQRQEHLVSSVLIFYDLISHYYTKAQTLKLSAPVTMTNSNHWKVLSHPFQFRHGVQHSRLSTSPHLTLLKHQSHPSTSAIMPFPNLVFSSAQRKR